MAPLFTGSKFGFGRVDAGFSATGGTITTYNGNTIHTFTAPGTFTVSGAPPTFNVEYVVVGGGGGSASLAGGGGAGGYITGTTPIGAGPVSKSVQVGSGGTGVGGVQSNDGEDSYFGIPITAAGGGGSSDGNYPFPGSGHGGGSGGGGRGDVGNGPFPGGSGNVYSPQSPNFPGPAPGQGYPGGSSGGPGVGSGGNAGAGGGGAGGAGESKAGVSYPGGYGGIGIQLPATFRNPASPIGAPGPGGGSFWVAGGGGGNGSFYGTGSGGSGGGPGGPYAGGGGGGPSTFSVPTQGTNGTANTGGGAGGGTPGSTGGSGIVLIAYPS